MAAFFLTAMSMVGKPAGVGQAEEWPKGEVVRAEMIVGTKDFSTPFAVGLRFELAPDWYLYWINPGDAGLAMEVRWILPAGFEAGQLRYPVPEKFASAEIIAFGYKNEVVFLCPITPKPGFQLERSGKRVVLKAEIDWLICKESCLRGLSRVEVVPSELKEDVLRRGQKLLSDFARRLPLPAKELELSVSDVKARNQGYRLEVEVSFAGPASSRVVDFYPYPLAEGAFEHARIRVTQGKLIIPLALFDAAVLPGAIKGLLIVDTPETERRGYEIEIPLFQAEIVSLLMVARQPIVSTLLMTSKLADAIFPQKTVQFIYVKNRACAPNIARIERRTE